MRSLCTEPSLGKQPLPQTARKSNKQPATGGLADTTYAIIILLYRLVTPLPRFRAQNEPSLHDTSFTDPAVTLFLFNSPVLSLQARLPASSPGACDTSLVPVRARTSFLQGPKPTLWHFDFLTSLCHFTGCWGTNFLSSHSPCCGVPLVFSVYSLPTLRWVWKSKSPALIGGLQREGASKHTGKSMRAC